MVVAVAVVLVAFDQVIHAIAVRNCRMTAIRIVRVRCIVTVAFVAVSAIRRVCASTSILCSSMWPSLGWCRWPLWK